VLKILFMTHEIAPFTSVGVMGGVVTALTRALKRVGHEVRIVTPRYGEIRERKQGLRDVSRLRNLNISIGTELIPATVKSGFVPRSKVQVYFVEGTIPFPETPFESLSDEVELRNQLFFVHTALQLTAQLQWIPDVIYCCDWKTAVAPSILKRDPIYHDILARSRTAFHGFSSLPDRAIPSSLIPQSLKSVLPKQEEGVSLRKLGMATADYVIAADSDAQVGTHGFQIEALCRQRTAWDPSTDPHLSQNYDSGDSTHGKAANKSALQKRLGLEGTDHSPLVALWGRGHQADSAAALEFIESVLSDVPLQLVAIGPEGSDVHRFGCQWEKKYQGRVASLESPLESDLRLVEAGADICLLPVHHHENGRQSLTSLLYGTIPILPRHESGGESVIPFDNETGQGNAFIFDSSDSQGAAMALRNAAETFGKDATWKELRRRGMDRDYCWEQAARSLARLLQSEGEAGVSSG